MNIPHAVAMLIGLATPALARAAVTEITDRAQWINAVGTHTYIGFTGFPDGTNITTQYAAQGVLFTDGNDFIDVTQAYPGDGVGLTSVSFTPPYGGNVHMSFPLDRNAIAFDFIGTLLVELYSNDELIFTSAFHGFNSTFVGFISDRAFDAVIAYDGDDPGIAINNLYFGAPVPAPGAVATLAFAMMTRVRRRRRQ